MAHDNKKNDKNDTKWTWKRIIMIVVGVLAVGTLSWLLYLNYFSNLKSGKSVSFNAPESITLTVPKQ